MAIGGEIHGFMAWGATALRQALAEAESHTLLPLELAQGSEEGGLEYNRRAKTLKLIATSLWLRSTGYPGFASRKALWFIW